MLDAHRGSLPRDGRSLPLRRRLARVVIGARAARSWVEADMADSPHTSRPALDELPRTVLDGLLEGCQVISRDYRYLYVNDAIVRQSQTTREALLGRTMMEAYPGIEDTEMFSVLRRCMDDFVPARIENEFTFPDGSRRWFELYFEPVNVGVTILSIDINDRKRAETEARTRAIDQRRLESQLETVQRLEAVGRLAGGVAHDFNNLLSVILTYAQFAIEALPESDPIRADIEQVHEAGLRAASLTRQLLAYSRRQVLERQITNLNDVVAGLAVMLRRLLREDITLDVLPAADLDNVFADPGQLEQVIMNVVVNAGDAMPLGGRIIIETSNAVVEPETEPGAPAAPRRVVRISIADTGVGMSPEILGRVFDPFFTTKETGKGTGLGLSTVYGIVKQSGGEVSIESELGRGTTVTIDLPPAEAAASRKRRGRRTTLATGDETILIAEDEEAVRRAAQRILEAAGYEVLTASNGDEAVALVRAHAGDIHLLLTDVVMPGMSGRELAERLEVLRPALKVLFVSGYTDDAIVHHGVLETGTPFLGKPFAVSALTRKVREVLDEG
jgi:PAS domain S-box-containing protein